MFGDNGAHDWIEPPKKIKEKMMEETVTVLVTTYEKMKRDLAIMRRDMRIVEKELLRIYQVYRQYDMPKTEFTSELLSLVNLIKLLKQR